VWAADSGNVWHSVACTSPCSPHCTRRQTVCCGRRQAGRGLSSWPGQTGAVPQRQHIERPTGGPRLRWRFPRPHTPLLHSAVQARERRGPRLHAATSEVSHAGRQCQRRGVEAGGAGGCQYARRSGELPDAPWHGWVMEGGFACTDRADAVLGRGAAHEPESASVAAGEHRIARADGDPRRADTSPREIAAAAAAPIPSPVPGDVGSGGAGELRRRGDREGRKKRTASERRQRDKWCRRSCERMCAQPELSILHFFRGLGYMSSSSSNERRQ